MQNILGPFKFEDVDKLVYEWFCIARLKNVPISGPIIISKATQIADRIYTQHSFAASQGWLTKFCDRHRIRFKALSGEGAVINEQTVSEWQLSLPSICEGYSAADIFNMDETGLFYQALPKKSFALSTDKCLGGKQSKLRLTVCLIASMEGEKLSPIVIGSVKRPRAFRRLDINRTFNIRWFANKTSWMTSGIFTEYLIELDAQMRRSGRKILMFLDNAEYHPNVELQHIRLVFFRQIQHLSLNRWMLA